jgi:hypothetical protein
VSLPVIVKMAEDLPATIRAAITPVLGGKSS